MQRRLAVWGALSFCAATALWAAGCGPPQTIRLSGTGGPNGIVARGGDESEVAEVVEEAGPQAWLWEVSGGPSDASPSYVLGTMHLAITLAHALPSPLDQHLYEARSVVMEVDMREAEQAFSQAPARPRPRRAWLDRALERPVWEMLVAELGDRVPPDVLRRLPPGALSLYLVQVRYAEAHAIAEGRTPVRGAVASARLDASIAEWAITRGRPLVPLETIEEALAALGALGESATLEALVDIVRDADEARAAAGELRAAYLSFDDSEVLRLLGESMSPQEREALLLGRNRAWMAGLRRELDQGNAFVAVGVGHLLGAESVLAMLHEAGYQVRRL